MTLSEKLKFCKSCTNRKMNFATGLVCGLSNEKPDFAISCPNFQIDQREADRLFQLDMAAKEEEDFGFFAPEKKAIKKGVIGGIIMMAIAVIWFLGGLFWGVIFYYPPILFVIGVYALIKGMIDNNAAGERK